MSTRIIFSPQAWQDYLHWQHEDRKTLKKLNALLVECVRNPHTGSGSPEPLRFRLSSWWSRRITEEHRLVYRVMDDDIEIASCRFHHTRR